MKKKRDQLTAFLLSALLLITGSAVGTTSAWADEKAPPSSIARCEQAGISKGFAITFNAEDESWFNAISSVKVAGTEYKKVTSSWDFDDRGENYRVLPTDKQVLIGEAFSDTTATCVISATGYSDLKLTLNKSKHTAAIAEDETEKTYKVTAATAENGTVSVDKNTAKEGEPEEGEKEIDPKDISVKVDSFNGLWQLSFGDSKYPDAITKVSVNGTDWEAYSFTPSTGGKYRVRDGALEFAQKSYGQTAALKSGDVISITAKGYKNLTFKVSIDNGKLTVSQGTKPGDDMQLHVRLVGSFESALVNQKGYDAISGASTNVTQNKNSNASVEVALVKTGTNPADSDWKLLSESDIRVKAKGSSVNIVNHDDPAKGNDSGMAGVYSVHDGSVTLAGTPAKAGTYDISVTITDELGRKATGNALTFRIFSGEETLENQLVLANCTKTADGKYMYDMEPWAIKNFTLDPNNETVVVPEDLKAWYGSHTSGTYGKLGYAIPEGTMQTQTLVLPKGCNLTLVNMDILSSVKILVQDGAKLTLRDSVVQGAVEVENGGTLSMNYNDYGGGEFLNGASINGKLILKDGSTLENAKIYSNTNNIANGSEARHNTDPVVVVNGNVTLKGKVFLRGDEAPTGTDTAMGKSYTGQTGMQVNGTLNLDKDAVLAVYGGGKDATTSNGGSAIILNGGTITGEGKLIAVGGDGYFGEGGNAVSGNGTISVADAYLEGGASVSKSGTPGKALGDGVKLAGTTNRNLIDGSTGVRIDYDNDAYWRDILSVPNLDLYPVEKNAPGEQPGGDNNGTEQPGGGTENPEKPGNGTDKPEKPSTPGKPSDGDSATPKPQGPVNPGDNGSSGTDNTKNKNENSKQSTVQTGDELHTVLWATVMLAALAGVGTITLRRRQKKQN